MNLTHSFADERFTYMGHSTNHQNISINDSALIILIQFNNCFLLYLVN